LVLFVPGHLRDVVARAVEQRIIVLVAFARLRPLDLGTVWALLVEVACNSFPDRVSAPLPFLVRSARLFQPFLSALAAFVDLLFGPLPLGGDGPISFC
jgi:hypothetical protein